MCMRIIVRLSVRLSVRMSVNSEDLVDSDDEMRVIVSDREREVDVDVVLLQTGGRRLWPSVC